MGFFLKKLGKIPQKNTETIVPVKVEMINVFYSFKEDIALARAFSRYCLGVNPVVRLKRV